VTPGFRLDHSDRLLLLAPHPDDETLGAGALLQRAVAAGAAVRVLFATTGENNPWTQRVVERRVRVGASDRARFGALRRAESVAALGCLGVPPEQAIFLGYADQGISALLGSRGDEAVARLAAEFAAFAPSVLVLPSLYDLHPDHSALSILARLAIARLDPARAPRTLLAYIIHRIVDRPAGPSEVRLTLTAEERARKEAAIRCHATQLAVHPRKFLSFAGPTEAFCAGDEPASTPGPHPVRTVRLEGNLLHLEVRPRARPGAFGAVTLSIAALFNGGEWHTFAIDLTHRSRRPALRGVGEPGTEGQAAVRRSGGRYTVTLPLAELGSPAHLLVKVGRRFGFFDEAGWRDIATAAPDAPGPESTAIGVAGPGRVVCVVPCYNVVALCGPVVREAAGLTDQVIAVDDGSTDGTGQLLESIAAAGRGPIRLLAFPANRGKGVALIEAFRLALADPRCGMIVTLDGDGQHRPDDIPRLVAACRAGAALVIGARSLSGPIPLRSRLGNSLIAGFLRHLYPSCPADTQSGFRALTRDFAEQVVRRVQGARYETETHMLLLALDQGLPVATVPIPTIYSEGNRSSHFRPLRDSIRIATSVVRWKLSGGDTAGTASGAPSPTAPLH
jgi:LmbE family N-acetylglucosaminyl deacetylase